MTPILVCLGLLCSPVTARVGNPPAPVQMTGFTQAVMSYPGHHFGLIFLAHLGTPEGWEIALAVPGERVSVEFANGTKKDYRVTDAQTLQLGFDTMKAYDAFHSAPVSFETCVLNGLADWGRKFVEAQ